MLLSPSRSCKRAAVSRHSQRGRLDTSRSMVSGRSPGPAPAEKARASACRLTASSWRACAQLKLRRQGAERGGGAQLVTEHRAGGAAAQGIRVVDAVASRERRHDQRERLRTDGGPARIGPERDVLMACLTMRLRLRFRTPRRSKVLSVSCAATTANVCFGSCISARGTCSSCFTRSRRARTRFLSRTSSSLKPA